jgi:hypothetical protein
MKAAVKSSSAILAACQLCKYNWQAAALIESARLQVYGRGVFDRQSLCCGEGSCRSFWGRDVSRGPHNDPEQGSQHRLLKNEGKEHSWCLLGKLHWDLSVWLVSLCKKNWARVWVNSVREAVVHRGWSSFRGSTCLADYQVLWADVMCS